MNIRESEKLMDENSHYKSFDCWGYHKGYYNEEDYQDILAGIDYSDRPECPKDEDDEEDNASFIWSCADHLLHGECSCFALALRDIFGYSLYIMESEDKKGFHAFCKVSRNQKSYYIDARGVTTSFEEFMTVASLFVGDQYTMRPATAEDVEGWEGDGEYYEHAFSFSKVFIDDHKEYYTV